MLDTIDLRSGALSTVTRFGDDITSCLLGSDTMIVLMCGVATTGVGAALVENNPANDSILDNALRASLPIDQDSVNDANIPLVHTLDTVDAVSATDPVSAINTTLVRLSSPDGVNVPVKGLVHALTNTPPIDTVLAILLAIVLVMVADNVPTPDNGLTHNLATVDVVNVTVPVNA